MVWVEVYPSQLIWFWFRVGVKTDPNQTTHRLSFFGWCKRDNSRTVVHKLWPTAIASPTSSLHPLSLPIATVWISFSSLFLDAIFIRELFMIYNLCFMNFDYEHAVCCWGLWFMKIKKFLNMWYLWTQCGISDKQ